MNQQVITKPPCYHLGVMVANILHQYLLNRTFMDCAGFSRNSLHLFKQPIEPVLNYLLWHLVLHHSSRGPCPLGVDKCKCAVILNFPDNIKGFFKICLRLPWKSHNNIRSKGNVWHSLTDFLHQAKILLFCVPTVHLRQDIRTSRLHR